MKLPQHKNKIQITVKRIADGKEKEEIYTGIPVRDLISDWSGILQAEFVSSDGMITAVSAEEILNSSRLILSEEPGGSTVRLIAGDDGYGQRWCKHIETVRFVEEEY